MRFEHKKIFVPKREIWCPDIEEFMNFPATTFEIEHSLFSISRWEAKYHRPYLSTEKTPEEAIDYIKMMVIGDLLNYADNFFKTLPDEILEEINDYIKNPMSATTVPKEEPKPGEKQKEEIITSELVYYWMSTQSIPFECEMWHINRLIKLLEVCAFKNKPEEKNKKMTSSDLALRRARMNAARAKYKKH